MTQDGSVSFDRLDGEPHVVFVGEISLSVAEAVDEADIAGCQTPGAITVDMTRCTLIDSLGITVLLRLRAVAGSGVRLVGPSSNVRRLLDMTGLSGAFTVEDAAAA